MSRATELADKLRKFLNDEARAAADELERQDRVNAELVKTLRQIREACGSTWVNKEWIAFHAGVAIAKAVPTPVTKETK